MIFVRYGVKVTISWHRRFRSEQLFFVNNRLKVDKQNREKYQFNSANDRFIKILSSK